ncbi:MAG: peptidase prepilin type [Proteobacteria bacterium]|nr:peptidase prepilin type [Pseudomonadota bacterium]
MNWLASVFLVVWAGSLAYEDWRWRRLPNSLLLGGVLIGAAHCLVYGLTPFGASVASGLLAALLGLLALLAFYARGWMGAGDVKLMAVVGWLGGAQVLLVVFLFASLLAGVMALLVSSPMVRPWMSDAWLAARLQGRIPFGAGVAAVLVALIFGWLDVSILPTPWAVPAHA